MTRNEYKKLKDFPKEKLIDIIKEEDRLIKLISECCVDADKDGIVNTLCTKSKHTYVIFIAL